MERKEFLKTMGLASATVVGGSTFASTLKTNPHESDEQILAQAESLKQNADRIKLGVSTYSYQHAIHEHQMTTEDCLAEMNSIGCESVQIIDGITIPNFPNPPVTWIDKWYGWLEKYKLTPSLVNTFLDLYNGWRGPAMTLDEQIEQMVRDMKLAKRLGFGIIRPTSSAVSAPLGEWLDAVVPYAEEIGVKVCPELHSPIPLQGEFVDRILGVIEKTGTKYIGFTLDMGDLPIESNPPQRPGAYGETERQENKAEDVKPLIPYIYNVHGKFYDMSDPKTEQVYSEVFKVLVEGGYAGSIDSEYEGQRRLHNQWCEPIDEVYQVRAHHVMMRKLLGRA